MCQMLLELTLRQNRFAGLVPDLKALFFWAGYFVFVFRKLNFAGQILLLLLLLPVERRLLLLLLLSVVFPLVSLKRGVRSWRL